MHLEGDVFQHWMTSAPTFLKKYEGLGHYPYVEAPERVIPDVVAVSGRLEWDEQVEANATGQAVAGAAGGG